MAYGIIGEKFNFKTDEEIEAQHLAKLGNDNDGFELASVNIDGQTISQTLNLSFEAVIVIVPENKKDDALHAAKEAGASGVTIMQGSGMGLAEMSNLYRTSVENSDSILLFILPSVLVEPVIKNITLKLHITTTGDGIVFSTPITHMKGISLRQQHVFKEGVEQVEQKVTDEKVHNQEILHNA
jgi:nitrogen regulatory protein PII